MKFEHNTSIDIAILLVAQPTVTIKALTYTSGREYCCLHGSGVEQLA